MSIESIPSERSRTNHCTVCHTAGHRRTNCPNATDAERYPFNYASAYELVDLEPNLKSTLLKHIRISEIRFDKFVQLLVSVYRLSQLGHHRRALALLSPVVPLIFSIKVFNGIVARMLAELATYIDAGEAELLVAKLSVIVPRAAEFFVFEHGNSVLLRVSPGENSLRVCIANTKEVLRKDARSGRLQALVGMLAFEVCRLNSFSGNTEDLAADGFQHLVTSLEIEPDNVEWFRYCILFASEYPEMRERVEEMVMDFIDNNADDYRVLELACSLKGGLITELLKLDPVNRIGLEKLVQALESGEISCECAAGLMLDALTYQPRSIELWGRVQALLTESPEIIPQIHDKFQPYFHYWAFVSESEGIPFIMDVIHSLQ